MKIFQIVFDIVVIWNKKPISVAAQSKSWVRGSSLAGIAVSNPAVRHGCLSVVTVVCCQVEVFATSRSLVQRSLIDCGASLCDLNTAKMAMARFEPKRHRSGKMWIRK